MAENSISIQLPDAVFARLEKTIQDSVAAALKKHLDEIHAQPDLLPADQVLKLLRISKPTLRKLEIDGKLIPSRAGRRRLYDRRVINDYLRER